MSFLAPLFLLGGLAIAGPIIFHLIRRVTRDRVLFSSSQFLRPVPPKVTRRRRIQHWILLLLRCACILLLALAFARPFFRGNAVLPPMTEEGRQVLLLVDTSASMRREGVWERARTLLNQHIGKISAEDELAIVAFDRQSRTLLSFEEWNTLSLDQRQAVARERIADLQPAWRGTQLGQALTFAGEQFRSEALSGNAAGQREVVLISDLQEGARLEGLQGYDWLPGIRVTLETTTARRSGNAGVAPLADNARGDGVTVSARLVNSRDSRAERFRLNWKSGEGGMPGVEAYVPPGQVRSFSGPDRSNALRRVELELAGDAEPFDNRAFFVMPEAQQVRIAWLGVEAAIDPEKPRFYFEKAFPESPRQRVEISAAGNNEPLSAAMLDKAEFTVIPRSLSANEASLVKNWISTGGSALLVLADDQMGPTLAALSGIEARVSEASGRYVLLSGINFDHPLFTPFADPRFSDFSRIHFWKHRRVDLPADSGARVLAKFDDETPALLEISVGKGSLLVLASGWHPADSQLAVASKFAPLMQTMLAWARAVAPSRHQFLAGDVIPAPGSEGSVQWRAPDGNTETRPGDAAMMADTPGFYSATVGGEERVFAVNLPADESRTAPMSVDVLARLGLPMGGPPVETLAQRRERALSMQRAELENQQKLWRWCLLGALGAILAESVLSGWLARREAKQAREGAESRAASKVERQEEFA